MSGGTIGGGRAGRDWGGAPAGWVPPEVAKEQQAANDAAAAMEARRAQEDERTQTLAAAIRDGFGMLSEAILAAAGLSSHERDAFFVGTGVDGVVPVHAAHVEDDPDDPDMDDLLHNDPG